MRIVRVPTYCCEVCDRRFGDSKSALIHEIGCRREAFLRERRMPKPDAVFRPCRIIRGNGSTVYGIFDVPCETVESAVQEAIRFSESWTDFEENFTVVKWHEGCVRDFEPLPSDAVDAVKRRVRS